MQIEALPGADRRPAFPRENTLSPGTLAVKVPESGGARRTEAKMLERLKSLRKLRGTGVDMTPNEGEITRLERELGLAFDIYGKPIPKPINCVPERL